MPAAAAVRQTRRADDPDLLAPDEIWLCPAGRASRILAASRAIR